jgi:hypothetical protein
MTEGNAQDAQCGAYRDVTLCGIDNCEMAPWVDAPESLLVELFRRQALVHRLL